MTDRLGHKQTAAMFTLMVLGREVPNQELQEVVGFTLTGKDRTNLNTLGYVESEPTGPRKSFVHVLSDSGWAWCEKELAAGDPPPPRGQSTLASALYVLLGGLNEYLARENKRLSHVFGPAEAPTVEATPAGDLEDRIRVAYRELVKEPRGWVGLVDLRPKLGAPAAEVDAVLKKLSSAGKVHLVPEDNRKALTAADHEAAIRIGGEDNHFVSFEAS
ncbi:hypothetical protein SAMN05421837_101900 [Amycolatopsis pretoriensis]|uniref:Uncharacterized protein n=1 Tax=Amycolatopsis pretoriensis TaxID=218821 RepID=A0A1H5Q5W0_9PSEU|nr:hypothetical protein [Amycolatopsis pretoriensis]SEF21502.1 hypothetical protein SAMN05421837_101900 [Amycolatopsis pretoriensis]